MQEEYGNVSKLADERQTEMGRNARQYEETRTKNRHLILQRATRTPAVFRADDHK